VSAHGGGFRVAIPSAWNQVSGHSLDSELKTRGVYAPGVWKVAYEPGPHQPSAAEFLSFTSSRPFVFAEFGKLSSTAHSEMSYTLLRDFFLPVTAAARQSAVTHGLPLTGFRLLRDQILQLGQGSLGIRETYDYTHVGQRDTFDMDAVANGGHTAVFVLLIHCRTACYGNYQAVIEHVMSSVTVSGSARGGG
jgi:hypothetical protein